MKRSGLSKPEGIDIIGDGGILKTILKEGAGEVIPNGKHAKVHYVGTLLNGDEFDSSRKRKDPFTFVVGRRDVILGWDKGVATMRKGEVCTLTCAPHYAYGSRGVGPIPPNSTLVFEVELLDWSDSDSYNGPSIFLYVLIGLVFVMLFYGFNKIYPKSI